MAINLNEYINDFLIGNTTAVIFEKKFSEYYDFEDLKDNEDLDFFKEVRQLLEHFSPFTTDIEKYPDYYWGENEMRLKIDELRKRKSK